MGGERSHHCPIPAPRIETLASIWRFTSINHAFLIWCYRNASFVFENDAATVYPVLSSWLLVIPVYMYFFFHQPSICPAFHIHDGCQPWRYRISVHVDS